MPKPLYFHRLAIKEARRAFRWYARRSPQVATRFRMSLTQAVEAIQANPQRWPEYLAGTRVVRLRRYPYLVIFRESPIEIENVAMSTWKRFVPSIFLDRSKRVRRDRPGLLTGSPWSAAR